MYLYLYLYNTYCGSGSFHLKIYIYIFGNRFFTNSYSMVINRMNNFCVFRQSREVLQKFPNLCRCTYMYIYVITCRRSTVTCPHTLRVHVCSQTLRPCRAADARERRRRMRVRRGGTTPGQPAVTSDPRGTAASRSTCFRRAGSRRETPRERPAEVRGRTSSSAERRWNWRTGRMTPSSA